MAKQRRRGGGRKPTPTKLKLLRGVDKVQPSRINRAEPEAPTGCPDPPQHLEGRELEAFTWFLDQVDAMSLSSTTWLHAAEIYADSYAKWRQAKEMVERLGQAVVLRGKDGQTEIRRNPFSVEAHKYKDQCVRMLAEFGMTASSKSRIVGTNNTQEESTSRWAEFLKGSKTG